MKKLFLSIALVAIVSSLYAQNSGPAVAMNRKEMRKERHEQRITLRKLEGKEVSTQSQHQFMIDFGNVPNVVWTRESYFDKATFVNAKGKEMAAYYDMEGGLVGTTSSASFSDLPPMAQKEIGKHYNYYEHAPVIFFDDNEYNDTDMILYGTQFDDADNYFIELADKKGRPVALKVDMQGNVSYFADMSHLKY